MIKSRTRIRFHVSVMAAILVMVLLMTLTTIAIMFVVSDRSVNTTAEELFGTSSRLAQERTTSLFRLARDRASAGAAVPSMVEPIRGFARDHPVRPYLVQSLYDAPVLYSMYVGRENGDFLQVIRADTAPGIIATHDAPEDTWTILRAINGAEGSRTQYWSFYDRGGTLVGERREPSPGYDPRRRPWYQEVPTPADGTDVAEDFRIQMANRSAVTAPYMFDSLRAMGLTASHALADGSGVVGVDLTLTDLERFVDQEAISRGGGLALLDDAGRIIAMSPRLIPLVGGQPEPTAPAPTVLRDLPANLVQREGVTDGQAWFSRAYGWNVSGESRWRVIAAAPVDDFIGPFRVIRRRIVAAAAVLVLVALPVVVIVARTLTRVLSALAADAARIRELDFGPTPAINSSIVEFNQLADGFSRMKDTLANRTRDLNASMDQLAKIIELNIAISAENDINRLSELILNGARELANADAGSLYLKDQAGTALEFQVVLTESLGFVQGGTSGNAISMPPVPLYDGDGRPNDHNVVTHAFHTGQTFNIADAYDATRFDFSGTRRFDEANGYRSTSMLTIPLKPRGSGIIGAMQLLNRIDPDTGEIGVFSPDIQRFVEALAAGAATALYNRDLIEAQRRLFDSMIRLIAGAIDAKSPYTGGHCARVPILAMMLGREAESIQDGPLASFRFDSEHDWRAFRIGAWLHDAGKVTTPDYVVDKSTKLETIYNRIHEIRTRFEVLLRDARIARHEAVLDGADPREEDAKLAETERRLKNDYAFVAECNLGGESLSDEHIQRLDRIASHTWWRHFDDTLGLSWEEANRLPAHRSGSDGAEPGQPVEERLLADKAEQVVPRTAEFYKAYEGYNFAIPVPEALYNRGELYNLKVGRGTLTPEERFKINEHVMQTIVMLEELPFPEELGRVAEYAGTHHETLNGTGYPRRLTGEGLSIPARIMAIADIFEALTASDRPYKRSKPLSVAVDILYRFKQDGHIDPDLFDLFLTSGAYRRYAEEYLKPDQLDEVDIDRYVG